MLRTSFNDGSRPFPTPTEKARSSAYLEYRQFRCRDNLYSRLSRDVATQFAIWGLVGAPWGNTDRTSPRMSSRKQRLELIQGKWTASAISIIFKPTEKSDVQINYVEDAYFFIRSLWDKELIALQEQVIVFFFNRKSRLIGYRLICTGSMEACVIDVRLLASLALHCMATSMILAHNHPSGNLQPSDADIAITSKIKKSLRLIDVKLLDHLIISETWWFSMKAEGLL